MTMTSSTPRRILEVTQKITSLFINIGIQSKILTLLSFIIICSLAITGLLGVHTTNQIILKSSQTKLESELSIGRSLMENKYSGNWQLLSGHLWKGDIVINGNNGIANALSTEIGDIVTIYQGDTSVSTSLKNSHGEYLTGGTLMPEIQQAVLKKDENFIGQQTIGGQLYEVAYEPIRDSTNKLIGVWSLAFPLTQLISQQTAYQTENLIIDIIVLILGLVIGWFMTNRMITPLKRLIGVAHEIGAGNLTAKIDIQSNDEIGQLGKSFNQMTMSLRNIMNELTRTSLQLAASSDEFSSSAEETNKAAQQVGLTIEEAATNVHGQEKRARESISAVDEMIKGVRHIADSAQSVSEAAITTTKVAGNGHQSVRSAVIQMSSVGESIEDLSELVNTLGRRTQDIGRIIEVITGLASQTNLLALNAAIEAARAGEQGRGFAVVAGEVRKLADQSAQAARQIGEFIVGIQSHTERAVISMQTAQEDFKQGIEAVNTAGISFEEIQESAKHVVDQIMDVSSASQQLTESSEQVLESIGYISETTSVTAASTEHIAAATEEQLAAMEQVAASANELSHMAEQMQALVARFKL
ncbi:methyl-accepting chemotaxis protein [Alicyclobacillus dauci]|uniref:Methyl-accepting chemotaxis protein n=1 Tax=Alicyclobacillus dauci TaxID=1475485 RepID=A0ABY6Z5C6_9BACL|nr:methyl-accepting chemotaxis protein [Alicyclobacillus dauci]WAH38093.1 methyl-accepting chemotaxis protein [Alicyclobacillus dauci]